MKRFLYERMVTEYSKETKEELIQRIISLKKIECEDRCFANQCFSGMSVSRINELFAALEELKKNPSHEDIENVIELSELAKNNWNYVLQGLEKINDGSRCNSELKDFKRRVNRNRESI